MANNWRANLKACFRLKPTPLLLTTDVVLFGTDSEDVDYVLLIQRKNPPFKNYWALPGGFVDPEEDLQDAALRELNEETSIVVDMLHQFKTYGNPNRDERGRVVTVAFWAKVPISNLTPKAQDDAKAVKWFFLDDLPDLAFDHLQIILDAQKIKT